MPVEPGTYVTAKVRLVRMMREGSMGQVWLAEHEALKTNVVVKFIAEELLRTRPDAPGRFEQEASTTARIRSPHVIQIYDYGEMADGTPFQVMELLEGENVGDRLDREGVMPAADVYEVIRQAGNALDLAHGRGIVHRDIKPQNINLEHVHGDLHVKVLDFGIAKRTLADEDGAGLTLPGMVVGTLEYLSREVVSGSDKVDFRVDLWALAVVAYKALTGKLPFSGHGMVGICTAIREGKVRRPSSLRPELPTALDDWFVRAFYPDSEGRFTSASQMARAFKGALEQSPSAGVYATPAKRIELSTPNVKLAAAIAGGALLVVFVILALALADDDDETAPSVSAPSVSAPPPASAPAPASAATAEPSAVPPSPTQAALAPSAAPAAGADGVAMVAVPAGDFWMGCKAERPQDCAGNTRPGRKVSLAAFAIDKTEVSTAAFGQCIGAGACSDHQLRGFPRRGGRFAFSLDCNWGQGPRSTHPINCVTYDQAAAYCKWAGKRLPTEAEWEKAARGPDGALFAWGDEPPSCDRVVMNAGRGGCGTLAAFPVGSKPGGASPYGALDMIGNVREWVADWYDHVYYHEAPAKDPPGPAQGSLRVARGGSWSDAVPQLLKASTRAAYLPHARSPYMGFRCARSAE